VGKRSASEDAGVVVFGSLARQEWIEGERDLDWTYLIDGGANALHFEICEKIKKALTTDSRPRAGTGLLKYRFGEPGPTGTFGNLSFSHPLLHLIGGQDDTNKNTSLRILLLLESAPIGTEAVHARVVRAIISRYLQEEEPYVLAREEPRFKVPRFLLNDVVRFWRTMAVDFASKQRDRGGQGWGLRNAKLRMSRKLIFSAGLVTCFSCYLDRRLQSKISNDPGRADLNLKYLENHIWDCTNRTPLDILASAMTDYAVPDHVARNLFSAYDKFISIVSDNGKREHLKRLQKSESRGDTIFAEVVDMSDSFEAALREVFFRNEQLSPLTEKYGVF
jgi:hypothetical protein